MNEGYVTETSLRVRYAETDRMGYAYYGNYAMYFEVSRVDSMKGLGFSYKALEDDGILMPVLEYQIKYHKPAFYDDALVIKTTIDTLPEARITFRYETFNEAGDKLNTAHTTLVFLDKESGKPRRAPEAMVMELEKYIGS